ncbi:hypothetical protein LINPERHAP1_LOCUS5964, partial [Linum perenne]
MIGRQQLELSSKLLVRTKQVGLKVGRVERRRRGRRKKGSSSSLAEARRRRGGTPNFFCYCLLLICFFLYGKIRVFCYFFILFLYVIIILIFCNLFYVNFVLFSEINCGLKAQPT